MGQEENLESCHCCGFRKHRFFRLPNYSRNIWQCRYDKSCILWHFHFNNLCCLKLYLDIDFWWWNQSGHSQDLDIPSSMVNHIGNNIQYLQHSNHICWIYCGDLLGWCYHSTYYDFLRPSFIKLIIYPLIALGVLSLLNITGFEHTIGFIEAAMSSAMLGLVLAVTYRLDWELTSDCIFTSTVFSLVTIPIFLMFIL